MTTTGTRPPFATIAIVGLGLIGGSMALAVRRRWPDVRLIGLDRSRQRPDSTRASLVDRLASRLDEVAAADLVVLAGPVSVNVHVIGQLPRYLGAGALVTDVGSTKRDIVRAAQRAKLADRFVGGHPVAGSERSGPEHARADLFDGATWVLTPERAGPVSVKRLRILVRGLGANVRELTPDAHDAAFAFVSHLPQVVASTLMRTVAEAVGAAGLRLGAGGLRDTTRLAASSSAIWGDILHANRDHVARALRAFEREITSFRHALDDLPRLQEALRAGEKGRVALLRRAQPPRARTARADTFEQ